jgi:hypothetical protein
VNKTLELVSWIGRAENMREACDRWFLLVLSIPVSIHGKLGVLDTISAASDPTIARVGYDRV